MYLFDSNIFLEILLDQKEVESCRRAFDVVEEQSPGWVTAFSLHAIEAILSHSRRYDVLGSFLGSFLRNKLLFRYDTTLEEEVEIAALTEKIGLDFDDALQYFVAKKENLILVTLDRHFQKVTDIQVAHPREVVKNVNP